MSSAYLGFSPSSFRAVVTPFSLVSSREFKATSSEKETGTAAISIGVEFGRGGRGRGKTHGARRRRCRAVRIAGRQFGACRRRDDVGGRGEGAAWRARRGTILLGPADEAVRADHLVGPGVARLEGEALVGARRSGSAEGRRRELAVMAGSLPESRPELDQRVALRGSLDAWKIAHVSLQIGTRRAARNTVFGFFVGRRRKPGRAQAVHHDVGRDQRGKIGGAGSGDEIGVARSIHLAHGAAAARARIDIRRGGEGHQEAARKAPRRNRRAGPTYARELSTHTTGLTISRRKLKDDRGNRPGAAHAAARDEG